ASRASYPSSWPAVRSVVVVGMGGSAIGGDLARGLLEQELRVPMMVQRDYSLPAFVDEGTLVVASSYSGNTEETLAAFDDARRRGAPLCVITTGGKLAQMAEGVVLARIQIPGGLQPRAALGYSVVPLLVL